MPANGGDAEAVLLQIIRAGVDVLALAAKLQQDGADAFVKSWQRLLQRIAEKSVASKPPRRQATTDSQPGRRGAPAGRIRLLAT